MKESEAQGGASGNPRFAVVPRKFSRLDHVLYLGAWLGFAAVLALAAWLPPDPSGVGTHTGLHLPPCTFYAVFHKPCPSCGMTTAFSLLLHGRPLEALRAQPAGVAVFAAGLWAWLYLPLAWRRRRPLEHIFDTRAFVPVVLSLIVLILAVWGWRMLR
ncbi:MAG: DUF2752 domain-containing protein [Acidobacteriota bacterium]